MAINFTSPRIITPADAEERALLNRLDDTVKIIRRATMCGWTARREEYLGYYHKLRRTLIAARRRHRGEGR